MKTQQEIDILIHWIKFFYAYVSRQIFIIQAMNSQYPFNKILISNSQMWGNEFRTLLDQDIQGW